MEPLVENKLPTLDIRTLLSTHKLARVSIEVEFEQNYQNFTDCLVNSFSNLVLKNFEKQFQDFYQSYPKTSGSYVRLIKFDLTNSDNISYILKVAKACRDIPPFDTWFKKISNHEEMNNNVQQYIEESFKRIARLAESKMNELFSEYSSFKPHRQLKYQVTLLKEASVLKVYLWVEKPTFFSREEQIPETVLKRDELKLLSLDITKLVQLHSTGRSEARKSYHHFAEFIVLQLAKIALKQLMLDNPYSEYPTVFKKFKREISFDLSKNKTVSQLLRLLDNLDVYHGNNCLDLYVFRNWIRNLSNNCFDDRNESLYIKELIDHVCQVVQEKLGKIMSEYIAELESNMLKYEAEFIADEKKLVFSLWIDEDIKPKEKRTSIEYFLETSWKAWLNYDQLTLPKLDIEKMIRTKIETKERAEENFEKNLEEYTDHLSLEIAKESLLKFQNSFDDEYANYPTKLLPSHFVICFDVTKFADRNILHRLSHSHLSPFIDWLDHLQHQPQLLNFTYFQTFFDKIALSAQEKLNKLMKNYLENLNEESLRFQISYESHYLNLRLWVEETRELLEVVVI